MDELELISFTFEGAPYGQLTTGAVGWQQEIVDGPNTASFKFLDGVKGVDQTGMRAWFDRRLMSQVLARYGHRSVFGGYIHSMELDWNDLFLQKSVNNMANSVICSFTDENGDPQYSDWFLDERSITAYGYKEKVVSIRGTSLGEAEARAYAHLQEYTNPYKSAGTFKKTSRANLRVNIKGRQWFGDYVFLLPDRLRYHPDHGDYEYGAETTVGDEIQRIAEIISYTSGWMYPLSIAENLTPTRMGVSSQMGAFSRIKELTFLPRPDETFENHTPMSLFVNNDGGIVYGERDPNIIYIRKPPPTGIETGNGRKPSWDALPGYLWIQDPQHEPDMPTDIKEDGYKQWIHRISMKMGAPEAILLPRERDLEDYISDVESNQDLIERWEAIEAAEQEALENG